MYVSDANGIVVQVYNAGAVVFSGSGVAYDSNVHKWIRLREASGTLFFETSTNGINWTTIYTTATTVISGWSLGVVSVELFAQRSTSQATGGYTSFDNLNLAPLTPQGNLFNACGGFTTTSVGSDPSGTGTGGSAYIATAADLSGATDQNGFRMPAVESAYWQAVTTPSGPGFQFSCSDVNVTEWSTTNRAVFAVKYPPTTVIGTTEDWTFDLYLPTQTLAGNWPCGVLWENHTSTSSGHHLALNNDGTYRIGRQSGPGQNYVLLGAGAGGPPIIWNTWVPIRFWVKWSLASDGFFRFYINGVQYVNFTGATAFAGEGQPWVQFGWYAERPSGVTSISKFGNIQRTVS
jgi:hypothetical protein